MLLNNGSNLTVLGRSSGASSQNLASLTLGGIGTDQLVVATNGGNSTTVTIGGNWIHNGTNLLNLDLSSSPGAVVAASPAAINGLIPYTTVTDTISTGLAVVSGGHVVRLTGQTPLPVNASGVTTNYVTSGVLSMTPVLNLAANSLTLDTSATAGSLDLGGVTLQLSSSSIFMSGSHDFTLTHGYFGTGQMIVQQYGTGTLTLAAGISSGAALTTPALLKAGPGNLVLAYVSPGYGSGAGNTTVYGGTLTLGVNSAIGNGPLLVSGATFDLGNFTAQPSQVTLANGGLIVGSGTLIGGAYSLQSGTVSASLGNAPPSYYYGSGLDKSTPGTVTLSGVNTYSGGTYLYDGLLVVGNAAALGNGTLYAEGGALSASVTGLTVANPVSMSYGSQLTVAGPNSLTLSGPELLVGGFTNNIYNITANVVTISGPISGGPYTGGNLTKKGIGTLILSALNTYTEATIVNVGTLELAPTGQVASSSTVMITGSGVLAGTGVASGVVTVGSGGTISPGSSSAGAVGTLTIGSAVFQPGGTLLLDLAKNPTGGAPGLNWDRLAVNGNLNLSALSSPSTFTLRLQSADPIPFNPSQSYTWLSIISAGSVSPPVAVDWFGLDTSAFGTGLPGTFSLVADGSNFDLAYTGPIPEPAATALLLGTGLLIMTLFYRQVAKSGKRLR